MKNCLVVLLALIACVVVTVGLLWYFNIGQDSAKGGLAYEVAEWRNFDGDVLVRGIEVTICSNEIIVQPPPHRSGFKRVVEKGHWDFHAFYCDSHVDAPAEVLVARELANEDLEFDVGRYLPNHPEKIVCVKTMRGYGDDRPAYPILERGQTYPYPPPKGLIRVGMLECDLGLLPWRPDRIELAPSVVTVDESRLSDGTQNHNFFADAPDEQEDEPPKTYTFHSDRADAPSLIVTAYQGRVTQVVGGAEETADPPYVLPSDRVPMAPTPPQPKGLASLLFRWFFEK